MDFLFTRLHFRRGFELIRCSDSFSRKTLLGKSIIAVMQLGKPVEFVASIKMVSKPVWCIFSLLQMRFPSSFQSERTIAFVLIVLLTISPRTARFACRILVSKSVLPSPPIRRLLLLLEIKTGVFSGKVFTH